LEPDHLEAWLEKGEAYLNGLKYEDAVRAFTRATQINPQHHGAQEGLQRSNIELKKSQRKDYYKILGLEKDCTERDVKKSLPKTGAAISS